MEVNAIVDLPGTPDANAGLWARPPDANAGRREGLQDQVPRPRQCDVSFRTLNVRQWDRMVDAWAADDDEAMDEAWFDGITVDLGSDYGAYEYVMNIGFAA